MVCRQDKSKDLWVAAEPERGKTAQLIPQLFFENMYLFTWSCVKSCSFQHFHGRGKNGAFRVCFPYGRGVQRPSLVHLLRKYIPIPQKPNLTTGYYFQFSII